MSRHRYPKSASIARQRARETEQLILSVMLLVLIVILWATGLWAALFAWAGDFILEQIPQADNT